MFLNRKKRDKDNETGLTQERGIEMSTTCAFHIRDARSIRFYIFTYQSFCNRFDHYN